MENENENEANNNNPSDSSSSSDDSTGSTVESSELDTKVVSSGAKIEEIFPDFMSSVEYELGANTSDYFVFLQFANDYRKRTHLHRVNPTIMRIFQEHTELAFHFLRFLPKAYKIPDPPQSDIDELLKLVDFAEKMKTKCKHDERNKVLINILKAFMANGKCNVKLFDEVKDLSHDNPDLKAEFRLFFRQANEIKWKG